MKKGKLRRDDSAHWYLIPGEKVEAFDELSEKMANTNEMSDKYQDLCDEFDVLYGEHALGGGPYELDVIIPE